MLTVDQNLTKSDVQGLSSRDALASFFLKLNYNVERAPQTVEALGITSDSLARHIRHIERLVEQDGWLKVYLFEMKSLRVADRQVLARTFRDLEGDFLLVLTTQDYDKLDFVLLERVMPEKGQIDALRRRVVAVRPRVLTVDRRDPGQVALRVLRRFTYTESDPFAQYDKLLSAYTVAEWAEPLFNNRALFSDYYLKWRLDGEPEWQEDTTTIFRELQKLLADVRERLQNKSEAKTRQDLLEPIFRLLGYDPVAVRGAQEAGNEPDYHLTAPGSDEPLVHCLAYVWNRYLDGADYTRDQEETRDENPGAQVITLLDRGDVPYVIVTNGKLWRLYAAAAHSRATNYYEIDLEETLASPEREKAIKYFWLFFRREAFVPYEVVRNGETREMCFLDRILEDSQSYAKELEDRLKDRTFEEIFPHFATGFIEHIRQQNGTDVTIEQDELDRVYQATLTFLYRLMFLLYAEARGLLPVHEVHGYHEVSLTALKEEIAEQGGDTLDEAPGKLRNAYRADSTALYDRLQRLFQIIDRGERDFNVPRYNGGLFRTDPDAHDTAPDAANARFLNAHKIPDRYLALGLDRLARDIDDKTQALAMIDYKSLGVRQLGSIYEGLLEFKLRIAPEKMAIVKGKRTEEVVPYRKASKKKILKTGRGQHARERTLPKGAVYLENTRQERKATGSYYTPDYIVQYIVEHTVGPVLDEKFEALRPRLREAEKRYRDAQKRAGTFKKQGMTPDEPEKVWNNEDMLRLAYDVLDVKVLDPAMGSGHFLVEAVDFITDRMLTFLNKFPHNPVRASLQRTRTAILESMERQGVSIDQGRLNDVALLKRQVLKRCVYGVDLNHMAVELAKVSLWLDAFTLGAPLSFLDHHLRWGNSLIGTMARDADEELGEEGAQLTLFGGPFAGLLRSAEIMRGIGMLADATMEQAQESANLFREFEEAARPYKQLLDVFVIRHFGVKRADEFLRLYGADVMTIDPQTRKLHKPYEEVLQERERLYQQYRFFHWDLEFPEVFIDLDRAEWKENAGFDAVVGNPPYVRIQGRDMKEGQYFETSFATAMKSYDVYALFIERSISLLNMSGRHAFIVPHKFFEAKYGKPLRKLLSEEKYVAELVHFGDEQVFEGVTIYVCILVTCKSSQEELKVTKIDDIDNWLHKGEATYGKLTAKNLTDSEWNIVIGPEQDVFERLDAMPQRLADITDRIYQGVITSADDVYLFEETKESENRQNIYVYSRSLDEWVEIERGLLKRVVRSSSIGRFWAEPIVFLFFPYQVDGDDASLLSQKALETKYPLGWKYLIRNQEQLGMRESGRFMDADFYRYGRSQNIGRWEQPKLMLPYMTSELSAYFDYDNDFYFVNVTTGGYGVTLSHNLPTDKLIKTYFFICAVLNTRLSDFYLKQISTTFRGGYFAVGKQYVEKLPLPEFTLSTLREHLAELVEHAHDLYQRSLTDGYDAILAFTDERLAAGQTDVIHDLLAFLAQQMIDLNKQKQAEIKRFLGWLEGQIGAPIDDLSGKTIIRGYLGDYQKGESELPFEELYDRLHRNRAKIAANLSDPAFEARIRREYEASLGALLPIKAQLKHTDRLIDLIVYKLYGLTEDEIAIVEGRA